MKPVTCFISYANQDEHLFKQFETHLKIMRKQGAIRSWHQGMIAPGDDWRAKTARELAAADVVLLLLSPDFLASDYLDDEHVAQAIRRHERQEARVIPIIVRDCQLTGSPLARLRALPKTGEPLSKWQDVDAFWKAIAIGIQEAIAELPPGRTTASVAFTTRPPSSSSSTSSRDMVAIRSAYRLLHQYHDHLFGIFRQAFHASKVSMGAADPVVGWGSHLFDLPTRKNTDPTDKWVYDFVPLAHAHIWWATSKKPVSSAVYLAMWHCGDDAVEQARDEAPDMEPDVDAFPPVEKSNTTLDFYVEVIARLDPALQVADWAQIDVLIEGVKGFDEETWRDGRIYRVPTSSWDVRYGGFRCDMSQLQSRTDVQKLVVDPLLSLIEQARAV